MRTRSTLAGLVALLAAFDAAAGAQSAEPLPLAGPIQRAIGDGPAHTFGVQLAVGQYLEIAVFQRGRDVALALSDSSGQIVASTDSPLGGFGPESIAVVAASPGEHRLTIRPSQPSGPSATYDLSVAALRAATPADETRVVALRRLQAGEMARAHGTAEALKAALADFEWAANAFHDIGDTARENHARLGIARAHDGLGQKRQAIQEYSEAAGRYRAAGDGSNEAFAFNLSAVALDYVGDRTEALRLLTLALPLAREAGDVRVEALTNGNTGLIHYQMGDRTQALDWYQRALVLHGQADNRRGQAATLSNIGSTYDMMGQKEQALPYLRRALELRRLLGEPRELATVLNNIGVMHYSMDQYERALALYAEAIPAWREAGDRGGEAATLHNVGNVRESLGEYQEAIDAFSQALPLQRAAGFRSGEANTLTSLGRVLAALGEYRAARSRLEDALALQRQIESKPGTAAALTNLASVHEALGDNDKAKALYDEALGLLEVGGNRLAEAGARQGIGRLVLGSSDVAGAEASLRASVDLYRAAGSRRGEALSLAHVARVVAARGQRNESVVILESALAIVRELGHPATEAAILYTLGRIERDAGHLVRAHDHARAALDLVESLRARVAVQDLRSTYLATVRDYYELDADVLMQLDRGRPGEGFATTALEISERARARTLLDSLADVQRGVPQSVDAELARQMRAVQAELNAKATRLSRMLDARHTAAEVSAQAASVATLTDQYRGVEARVRRSSPRYASLVSMSGSSFADLRAQLDSRTALVEYMLGAERSYVWVLTESSIFAAVLPPRAVIEKAAREFLSAVGSGADVLSRTDADRLADIVIAPLAGHLSRPRLVIVADGLLAAVPFAALSDPDRPAGDMLVAAHEIVNAPSVSVVAQLRAADRRARATKTVAVFADPVFSPLDVRVRGQVSPPTAKAAELPRDLTGALEEAGFSRGTLDLGRLIGSRREASAISALAPEASRRIALDFGANRAAASAADLRDYRILHFATHALINNVHPELSGIVLSLVDAQGRPQDGFLRLHDIYNLDLSAQLVVLSACRTGLGREIRGEGLIGLTRGFLYAGAQRVVASMWPVDDRATAELMSRFYAAVLGPESMSPAAALAKAQRSMRGEARWQSPYYWAGFVLQGDWR